jgi:hypothetical protein
MDLKKRVGRLEAEIGVNPTEPIPLKTIFVVFAKPGTLDVHGNRAGGGECDSRSATVCADFRDYHFERGEGETVEAFRNRLLVIPWGRKNSVRIVYLWPGGDCEPVPRENAPTVES